MKKTLSHSLSTGMLATATFFLTAPASAQITAAGCGYYQPGMLAFLTGVRLALCTYQGDYMVNQGPMYDGPARIAPQPAYEPARTVFAGNYPYVHGQYKMSAPQGKPRVIKAQAEVRIYGRERMDIRLYRR